MWFRTLAGVFTPVWNGCISRPWPRACQDHLNHTTCSLAARFSFLGLAWCSQCNQSWPIMHIWVDTFTYKAGIWRWSMNRLNFAAGYSSSSRLWRLLLQLSRCVFFQIKLPVGFQTVIIHLTKPCQRDTLKVRHAILASVENIDWRKPF